MNFWQPYIKIPKAKLNPRTNPFNLELNIYETSKIPNLL